MLTVFNVRQGDAFLLHPEDKGLEFCEFSAVPLLIDTGPACARVSDRIADEKISVLITHSDNDHLGGLASVLRKKTVDCLYIPYYLPEMVRIREYLKKHLKNKTRPLNWKKLNECEIKLLSNKRGFSCHHACVLNPPHHEALRAVSGKTIKSALEALSGYGIDVPLQEIENYQTPVAARHMEKDAEYSDLAKAFVQAFFVTLADVVQHAGVEKDSLDYYVARHVELTANNASLVFKYQGKQFSWLFTGDAGQSVFERLILEQVELKSDFLKVPHHGSSGNLSQHIIEKIAPKYAIVSHGNRKYGRAREAHPHIAVIDLLDAAGVDTYYTNPVKKLGIEIKSATVGFDKTGLVEFV